MGESFFVDPTSGTATTTWTEPSWGYEKRSCDQCGSDWAQFGCSKSGCTSVVFTTTYVPPVPFMRRVQEKLASKAKPRASRAQVESLRALQAAVTALIADLRRSEQELVAAVRADVEELQWAQALVHRTVSTSGDLSTQNIDGVSLGLPALAAYLSMAITNIEDQK
jgi:protein-arginine kinase activator protein McsA